MISNIEDDMRSYFVSGSVSWTLAKPSRLGDLHWDAKPSASALNRCLLVFHQDPQVKGVSVITGLGSARYSPATKALVPLLKRATGVFQPKTKTCCRYPRRRAIDR